MGLMIVAQMRTVIILREAITALASQDTLETDSHAVSH